MTKRSTAGKRMLTLYGNTLMERAYCHRCEGWALVVDGELRCCDSPVGGEPPSAIKRDVVADRCRRIPPLAARNHQLSVQRNRCLYCGSRFGDTITNEKSGRVSRVRLVWDHLVPYSWLRDSSRENFVAACSVCNGIKSNKMFPTLDEVVAYVRQRRGNRGYPLFDSPLPSDTAA